MGTPPSKISARTYTNADHGKEWKMDNGELKMIGNLLVMFVASSSRCFHFPFSIFHYLQYLSLSQ
jgi:hypothetical protein